MRYLWIAGTIALTVYGQLVMKWQMSEAGDLPGDAGEAAWRLVELAVQPWMASALLAGFGAALCWMAALNRFDLTHAYPFTALSFVLVLLLGGLALDEPVTTSKLAGITLISAGIVVGSGVIGVAAERRGRPVPPAGGS